MSATRGWCWLAPPARMWVSAIHPQANRLVNAALEPRIVVPPLVTTATRFPFGERNWSAGPCCGYPRMLPAVQLRTLDCVPSQQITPAGEADPTIGHEVTSPSVNRRAAVAGSTT